MTHTYRGKRCHTRPRCSLKVHNRRAGRRGPRHHVSGILDLDALKKKKESILANWGSLIMMDGRSGFGAALDAGV
jgi:hypothetical protein